MNLEKDLLLNEQASHKKGNIYSQVYEISKVVKFIKTERRIVVTSGWERRSPLFNGNRVGEFKIKKFYKSSAQQHDYTQQSQTVYFKMVKMINFTFCVFFIQ